ncbi:CRE-DVE-1 protein, partial [Aphelenchoides avenae]
MLPIRISLVIHGRPLVDNYVVVDDSVKLCDLIGTALTHLGYAHLTDGAQGFIQVGNWKPLTLEQISDDHDQPASKLLKSIAYDVILKVVVLAPSKTPTAPKEIDERFSVPEPRLSDSETVDNDSDDGGTEAASGSSQTLAAEPSTQQASLPITLEQMLHQFLQHQGPLFDAPASTASTADPDEPKMTRSPSPEDRRYGPMTGPVKPCFDTIYEVPMLQGWYSQLKFPGKAQCQLYADELNSLSHRRTNPAVSWQTVSNWFKNRRRHDRRKGVMTSAKAEIL